MSLTTAPAMTYGLILRAYSNRTPFASLTVWGWEFDEAKTLKQTLESPASPTESPVTRHLRQALAHTVLSTPLGQSGAEWELIVTLTA